jgi:lycopene beta-cyclase
MTYLQFHLVFILPPLLAMAVMGGRIRPQVGTRGWLPLVAVALIAFVYTTPWDNYLVYREIWWYGPDRVVGTIGYVPVEEYLFFLLQPFLTGLFTFHVLARLPGAEAHGLRTIPGLRLEPPPEHPERVRWLGALPWFLLAGVGVVGLTTESGLYMGLILAWAAPVVGAMWLYMGPRLWRMIHVMGLAVAVPTLYLWVADTVAIRNGIWEISQRYTLGPRPLGLPLEEAAFFLITNVLVVVGVLLFALPGLPREMGGTGEGPVPTGGTGSSGGADPEGRDRGFNGLLR